MLCINNYTRDYIDACRARVGLQVSTYRQVGDEIGLNEADFVLISDAFFADIERKYL